MRRSVIALIVASLVTVAALTSMSLGLGRMQRISETAGFSGMWKYHTSDSNNTLCEGKMPSQMKVTQYMGGGIYIGHEAMHNQRNMTDHTQDMYEANVTAPHMESNYGSCHN